MLPLKLRPIDDINVRSCLGSARNRGHKVCFERGADITISLTCEVCLASFTQKIVNGYRQMMNEFRIEIIYLLNNVLDHYGVERFSLEAY